MIILKNQILFCYCCKVEMFEGRNVFRDKTYRLNIATFQL
jgi:hypothetical protein